MPGTKNSGRKKKYGKIAYVRLDDETQELILCEIINNNHKTLSDAIRAMIKKALREEYLSLDSFEK